MNWYFLIYLMMSHSGEPSANPIRIYTTLADCESAGLVASGHVTANAAMKHGIWQCMPVDFDAITAVPKLRGPLPEPEPKRRVPGRGEAS